MSEYNNLFYNNQTFGLFYSPCRWKINTHITKNQFSLENLELTIHSIKVTSFHLSLMSRHSPLHQEKFKKYELWQLCLD